MYGVRRCGYPCAAVLRPSGGASGRLCIVRWRGTLTLRGFEPLLAIVLLIRRALVAGGVAVHHQESQLAGVLVLLSRFARCCLRLVSTPELIRQRLPASSGRPPYRLSLAGLLGGWLAG